MTLEVIALLVVLAAMAVLFLTEKLPLEVTAFAGLSAMVLAGWVTPDQAFTGFSSPAVITMIGTFFLGAALLHTGVAEALAARMEQIAGKRDGTLAFGVTILAGSFSAFMNNVAATAMLLPAVASLARRTGISPSKLMMPLAFGTILGGTVTLVGTPANMIASDLLRDRGLQPFALLDFAPIGLALLIGGAGILGLLAGRILPARVAPVAVSRHTDLFQIYQLHDALFSIRVPKGSGLEGRTLRETGLGRALDVQVVGITREGRSQLAPTPGTRLEADDVLLVQGRASDVRELFRVRGTDLQEARSEELEEASRAVDGIVAKVLAGSTFVGKTLREINFRHRFGLMAIAIRRGETVLEGDLAARVLAEGDELFLLGPREKFDAEELRRDVEVSPMGPDAFRGLSGSFWVLRVSERSELVGTSLARSRIGELVGLTVTGILRESGVWVGANPEEAIRAGDRLLVVGEPARIRALLALGGLEMQHEVTAGAIEAEGVAIEEATVAPRSNVAGRTLAEIDFRERYGLTVLAVWRQGQLLHEHLAGLRLAFGDALLLHGPVARIRQMARGRDFVVLSAEASEARRTKKAPWAVAGIALLIGLALVGWQPPHVAAFLAGTLVVLTRSITMEEAYRAIEWRVVFLVAAILPIGAAMESTGAAAWLTEIARASLGGVGPQVAIAVLAILASLLSQLFEGAPAVVMLAPVAFAAAGALNIDARPLMVAVALGASAAYLAPFSAKSNLLVMGAGGYRAGDYFRAGLPLTILHLVLTIMLVPLLFPF